MFQLTKSTGTKEEKNRKFEYTCDYCGYIKHTVSQLKKHGLCNCERGRKNCVHCGEEYFWKKGTSIAVWEKSRFCSTSCSRTHMVNEVCSVTQEYQELSDRPRDKNLDAIECGDDLFSKTTKHDDYNCCANCVLFETKPCTLKDADRFKDTFDMYEHKCEKFKGV